MGHLYHSDVGSWELKQRNSGCGWFFDVFSPYKGFPKTEVPPNHPILTGFSLINYPFLGYHPDYGTPQKKQTPHPWGSVESSLRNQWRFPWGYPKIDGLWGKILENTIQIDDLRVYILLFEETLIPSYQWEIDCCKMCCHPLTIRYLSYTLVPRRRSEKCPRVTRSRPKAKLLPRLCRASHSNIKNMWYFICKQNKWLSKCHKLWFWPSNRSPTM